MASHIVHRFKPCNVCDVLRLEIRFFYLCISTPAVTVGICALMCRAYEAEQFCTHVTPYILHGAGQELRLEQIVSETFLL